VDTCDHSRASSTFYRKPSYFDQSSSFCSTSFETNTLESRAAAGNFFLKLFRAFPKKIIAETERKHKSQDQNCTKVRKINEGKSLEEREINDYGGAEEGRTTRTKQNEDTPDGMIVMLKTPQEKFSIGAASVQGEMFLAVTCKDHEEQDISLPNQCHTDASQKIEAATNEIQNAPHRQTNDMTTQPRSLAIPVFPEELSDSMTKASFFPMKKSINFLSDISREAVEDEATKAEASIWNGFRQNFEFPLDTFHQNQPEEQQDQEKTAKRKSQVHGMLWFPSMRLFALGKVEDINNPTDAATTAMDVTTAPCEASIWNGQKEALEVPLGGDQDLFLSTKPHGVSMTKKKSNMFQLDDKEESSIVKKDSYEKAHTASLGYEIVLEKIVSEDSQKADL
jgi:hypothetical protein